ncbi:glycosyltransferase family 9 protein [Proteus terrae subsp. cibarius]|uniref:Lipopolysaccharide heptosyltransferase family protein n=1 Tax=Proteus terrae subsp. cibarius TaxID=626774 RepID=A0ABX6JQJ7_9GAMM|nr:glycosyltransferase family 9 protein [Proteus terrae]MBG3090545.1 glycosyltransferase family 9 protein [Proteus terrae subsp. cibarius]QGW01509.1 glycosyltransferase family 9 protein [Proteus terrae subsp. cibarius]QIF91471.1 lipopolysaccharide heptosyltransferase family protein [Proteus terrae subsp. cibarius]WCG90500.1 glycosyltransferase family 9 protein [Proteus terrae]
MGSKKFSTLRRLNRQKNYFFKRVKFAIAKFFIDSIYRKSFSLKKDPKVLFLRDDNKIGDMVVSTSILRQLKNNGYSVDIVSGNNNFCVIEYSDLYNKNYTYEEKFFSIIKLALRLRKESYDLIIDMGELLPISYLLFIRIIDAKNAVGFNKKSIKVYNLNIDYNEYKSHVIERYKKMLNVLNVPFDELKYEITIPYVVDDKIKSFINNLPYKKTVVINPFSASEKRDISKEQLLFIISYFKEYKVNIIFIGKQNDLKSLQFENIVSNPIGSFISASAIIKYADLVITPDTSIVHVATTFDKPTLALYGNDYHGLYVNNYQWSPNNKKAIQVTQDKIDSKVSEISTDVIKSKLDILVGKYLCQ